MNFVMVLIKGSVHGKKRNRESVGDKVGLENGLQTDILIDCICILSWHQVMMCIAELKTKLLNRVKSLAKLSAFQILDVPIHRIQVMCQAGESGKTNVSLVVPLAFSPELIEGTKCSGILIRYELCLTRSVEAKHRYP